MNDFYFKFISNIYILTSILLIFFGFILFIIIKKTKKHNKDSKLIKKNNFKNKNKFISELEKTLYNADFSSEIVKNIINNVEKTDDFEILKKSLKNILLDEAKQCEAELKIDKKPFLIVLLGVNGVGKTTMAARLAKYFKKDNKKVILIGADTFRAAAVEQLEHWAKKIDVLFFSKGANSDIGANVYEGINKAKESDADIIIVDTGGRIHTKDNLMSELKKLDNVIKKQISDAPHLSLLVLDANMGQNLIVQSKVFNDFINISGLALTKMDGSAKGGALFKISKNLNLPVYFIGVGEDEDSLIKFNSQYFVNKII